MALMGLVIVSFMVTAAIVSSGAEVMSSSAHQRATTALYGADGALERYVADKSALAAAQTDRLHPTTGDTRISGFSINVARLYKMVDTIPGDTVVQTEVFSVLANPSGGRGRSVGGLIPTVSKAKMFDVSVTSGLTVGGNVKVTGNSTISDGRNIAGCEAAPNALQVTSGSAISKDGSAVIEGKADTASFAKEELVNQYLGGLTIREAAKLATIKFAAGEFNGKPSSLSSGVPREPVATNRYNWGCPANDGCAGVAGNEKNRAYYPTVAIDAGGGKVSLNGDHGQGILLIYNGSLDIQGNFNYQGIILVERDLTIKGTGGSSGGVKIEGAVMSLGENSTVEDNASGNAVVTYNSCVVNTAERSANTNRIAQAPQQFPTRTNSWFEVLQ